MQHARNRIRELTARERLLLPVERVVRDVNVFLRGWAGYFRYGNSARTFDKVTQHALNRLAGSWPNATGAAGAEPDGIRVVGRALSGLR